MQLACDKVDAMFISNRRNGFDVPTPVAKTVYVSQGMRDQEAILLLESLEAKKTDIAQTKVIELIKLAPFFA